jgi:flagellar M-ring protein FliF
MKQGLSQLHQQLLATWKLLGLNQRVSIVVTGLVVLGGLLTLTLWSSRADYALLYGRLDETEAAKVIAALDEARIPYRAATGGSILVPSDKVHSLRMQLAGKGIPRGEGVGFEIFDKPNFGVSDFIQRANYNRAIQGELARTISQLDSVENARVMIVLPENRLLIDNQRKPTASVFLRLRGSVQLSPSAVNAIQLLVANAVEGLQYNQVSVVDNQGNLLSQNPDEDSTSSLSGNQLAMRRNFEQYLSRKAEDMLERVLGPGQAVVRVSADINWDTITRFEERFDPEGQVARTTPVNDENIESGGAPNGGIPGITGNIPPDTNSYAMVSSASTATKTKKKVTNSQFEINRTVSSILQSPGGVQRLSAAVFVAERFEGTATEPQSKPRSTEELERLRRIVQSALGINESDPDRNDEIILEEMAFSAPQNLEVDLEENRQERWQFWTDLVSRLGYPALALVIFALLWRALRRAGASNQSWSAHPSLHNPANGQHATNGNGLPAQPGDPLPNLISVDVLNRLIRENPANMTQAVRTWLNRGNSPK